MVRFLNLIHSDRLKQVDIVSPTRRPCSLWAARSGRIGGEVYFRSDASPESGGAARLRTKSERT